MSGWRYCCCSCRCCWRDGGLEGFAPAGFSAYHDHMARRVGKANLEWGVARRIDEAIGRSGERICPWGDYLGHALAGCGVAERGTQAKTAAGEELNSAWCCILGRMARLRCARMYADWIVTPCNRRSCLGCVLLVYTFRLRENLPLQAS